MMISISDDGGETWRQAFSTPKPISNGRADEPSAVEYAPGKIMVFIRAKDTGYLYCMRSIDGGESWTEPKRNILRHASNPVDVVKIPDSDTIVLIRNSEMNPQDIQGSNRHILCTQLSDDGGLTWYNYRELENHRDWRQMIDYPAVVFKDHTLHLVFRHLPDRQDNRLHNGYEHVRYLNVNSNWLFQSP
jgi:predicted neuraminidase